MRRWRISASFSVAIGVAGVPGPVPAVGGTLPADPPPADALRGDALPGDTLPADAFPPGALPVEGPPAEALRGSPAAAVSSERRGWRRWNSSAIESVSTLPSR